MARVCSCGTPSTMVLPDYVISFVCGDCADADLREAGDCNEVLFIDGEPTAVCIVPFGTEHSHNDMTATGAIETGTARPYADESYEVRDDGTIPVVED